MNYIRRYDPEFDWEKFHKELMELTFPDGFDKNNVKMKIEELESVE